MSDKKWGFHWLPFCSKVTNKDCIGFKSIADKLDEQGRIGEVDRYGGGAETTCCHASFIKVEFTNFTIGVCEKQKDAMKEVTSQLRKKYGDNNGEYPKEVEDDKNNR